MNEQERRHYSIQNGLQSTYLEGGVVSQAFLDDVKEFEALRIDEDEMFARIRKRYGL